MKIVCESCQAKYSIADEKVAGKVFKIRCKRCGTTIVVRSDEHAQAGGGAVDAGAGEAIWHVVVNGEQHGPYDPAQLAEMLSAGTVDWEAYVWCEGFDNWSPMRDAQDLVAKIMNPGAQRQSAERVSVVNYSTPPSMGADPFADDSQSAPGPVDASAGDDAGPDLFGPSARSPRNSFDAASSPAAATAPMPSVGGANMIGARDENSVLFSLKNLQSLATRSSPSLPPVAARPAAGFATAEDSGLIDIRALASATGMGSGDAAGEKDDLLAIGSQGGAFGALGSPMLAPAAEESGGNKKVIILAGVAATAFLSLAAVAIVYLLRPQAAPPAQAVVAAVPAAAAPAAAAPAAAAPEAAPAMPATPTEGEAEANAAARVAGGGARPKRTAGGGAAAKSAARNADDLLADVTKTEDAKPSAPKGPRTIDDLLSEALTGESAPKPDSSLPDNPGRDDVKRALDSVKGAVSACAPGQGGVAIVNVTVAGTSGRVTNAQVEGITGPAGSCIAREVRKASFPKFKNATFKVKYPYRL